MRVEFFISKEGLIESVRIGPRKFFLREQAKYPGDIQEVLKEINVLRILQTKYTEQPIALENVERLLEQKQEGIEEDTEEIETIEETVERFMIQNPGWWNASRIAREIFNIKTTSDNKKYRAAYKRVSRVLKSLVMEGKVLAILNVPREIQIQKYKMDPEKSRDGNIYSYNTEYGMRLGADLFKRSIG